MRKGTCKYFNGTAHNKQCEAGIVYDDVTPEPGNNLGKGLRLPCHSRLFFSQPSELQQREFDRRGTCQKYTEPSDAEIAEHEAEIRRAVDRIQTVLPIVSRVKELHKGENWSGVDACPNCGAILHLTHAASNGHVHGQGETQDCVSFME